MNNEAFKAAVGCYPTGVAIITVKFNNQLYGFTANSFTSVSLEPELISFCLNVNSRSLNAFLASQYFGVNILTHSQQDVAKQFATPAIDKFAGTEIELSANNVPIIAHSASFLECVKYDQKIYGDHYLFVASVLSVHKSQEEGITPLVYYQKNFRGLS